MDEACSVEECTKPVRTRGLCYAHYMKSWRYGTPTPQHPSRVTPLLGKRFGKLAVTAWEGSKWLCECDCGKPVRTGTYNLVVKGQSSCRRCAGVASRSSVVGYDAAHGRVRRARGKASDYACVDCGGAAAQWSYDHTDPAERTEDLRGYLTAYSLDQERYVPRCVPCHKVFDLSLKRKVG